VHRRYSCAHGPFHVEANAIADVERFRRPNIECPKRHLEHAPIRLLDPHHGGDHDCIDVDSRAAPELADAEVSKFGLQDVV